MKKFISFYNWRTVAVFVVMSVLTVACHKDDLPIPVVPPVPPPAPVVYVKPVVSIKEATDVKITSATISAKVVPNEKDTEISFEYKDEGNFEMKTLPQTFSGKDSVSVKFEFSDLKANTKYSFRVRSKNIAGEVVSDVKQFWTNAVMDIDGNYYHSVTIGTQTWTVENLKTEHYNDGSAIANVTDNATWAALNTPAYCYYDNDLKNKAIYGALYNWHVVNTGKLAPAGWHVPSDPEWTTLKAYLGTLSDVTDRSGIKMREVGFSHWIESDIMGTNESGFTALPGGARDNETGLYGDIMTTANFWSTTNFGNVGAYGKRISYYNYHLSNYGINSVKAGVSIRCIKN